MSSYKLKPGIDLAFIGGVGRVGAKSLLEGDQFAKHVPGLLVEVPETPNNPPLESTNPPTGPQPLNEPAPSPSSDPQTEGSSDSGDSEPEVSGEEEVLTPKVSKPSQRPKANKASGEK